MVPSRVPILENSTTQGRRLKPLRIGIIGFGKMGRLRAAALARVEGVEVVRVHDPGGGDIEGHVAAPSEESVLEDGSLDAVFVCTPNHRNRPLTIAALRAGRHVFCEKPPAFTAAEVEEVMAVEKASGRKLMYGFNHRHHASIKAMCELIATGEHGRILWMRGRYGKSVDQDYFGTWRARKELAGGGILIDQGIHMVDLFLLLAGDFHEVQGMVSSLYWNLPGIEDNVFALFRNRDSGIVASLHSTMTQWRHLFSLEVFLERGYLTLNGLKTQSGTYGDEVLTIAENRTTAPAATWKDERRAVFPADTSWDDETRAFVDAIRFDRPITTGNSGDALKVMRLIDTLYQAEQHRSPVLRESLLGPQRSSDVS